MDPKNYEVFGSVDGFHKLLTITAVFFSQIRVRKLGEPEMSKSKELIPEDYIHALRYHVKISQDEHFWELKQALQQGKQPEKALLNKFGHLKPVLGADGVLRIELRSKNINHLPYDQRYPMVLDAQSDFTKLLVRSYHRTYGDPVSQAAEKLELKKKFNIFGLQNLLRHISKHCLNCRKRKARPLTQRMADFPAFRFQEPLRQYSKTGIDFAGPFQLRGIRKGRSVGQRPKKYILLFTCLQTRHVHLEVTEAMDTKAVVNALIRFGNARGRPDLILSDNWSTFKSVNKDLELWVRSLDEGSAKETFSQTVWKWTPPYGPHHGGLYEIMVKATKRALEDICNYPNIDMDEFRTYVSTCQALINDRPLTRTVRDEQIEVLTPNHFCYGRMGCSMLSTTGKGKIVQRWFEMNQLLDRFWKQLMDECVLDWTRQSKWKETKKNLKVGDLVLVIEEMKHRGRWEMAVVEEVSVSQDGLVRKARIRKDPVTVLKGKRKEVSTYWKPITGLIPLEFQDEA